MKKVSKSPIGMHTSYTKKGKDIAGRDVPGRARKAARFIKETARKVSSKFSRKRSSSK